MGPDGPRLRGKSPDPEAPEGEGWGWNDPKRPERPGADGTDANPIGWIDEGVVLDVPDPFDVFDVFAADL